MVSNGNFPPEIRTNWEFPNGTKRFQLENNHFQLENFQLENCHFHLKPFETNWKFQMVSIVFFFWVYDCGWYYRAKGDSWDPGWPIIPFITPILAINPISKTWSDTHQSNGRQWPAAGPTIFAVWVLPMHTVAGTTSCAVWDTSPLTLPSPRPSQFIRGPG